MRPLRANCIIIILMKSVLITGSTDGIGREAAKQLSQKGFKVLLHGRNAEKLKILKQEIPGSETYVADFSDMTEVGLMARAINNKHKTLDVLINNAGVYMNEQVETLDGFEKTMAVNYFSHVLLTHHLLPALINAQSARIVHVSSVAHRGAQLDINNLNLQGNWNSFLAYANSKQANILFSNYLARTLPGHVTSNAVHPGVINTKLLRDGWGVFGRRVRVGASSLVYLATQQKLNDVSGKYFDKKNTKKPSLVAQDAELAKRLFTKTKELLAKKW